MLHSLGNAHGDLGDHATKRDLLERALDNYKDERAEVARQPTSSPWRMGNWATTRGRSSCSNELLVIEERELAGITPTWPSRSCTWAEVYATTGEHAERVVVLNGPRH